MFVQRKMFVFELGNHGDRQTAENSTNHLQAGRDKFYSKAVGTRSPLPYCSRLIRNLYKYITENLGPNLL